MSRGQWHDVDHLFLASYRWHLVNARRLGCAHVGGPWSISTATVACATGSSIPTRSSATERIGASLMPAQWLERRSPVSRR